MRRWFLRRAPLVTGPQLPASERVTSLPLAVLVAAAALTVAVPACERAEAPPHADRSGLRGGRLVFEDDFSGEELGEHWRSSGEHWRLERGEVRVADARNDALWLSVPLPEQVRVEFDVTAQHEDGDLKFELFGDGENHESGYILIYGGWQNSTTCIARLNEHGRDRLDREEHVPVERGRTYRFTAVRTDNRLRWYIDGDHVLTYDDPSPLEGEGHRHLAFNNWAAPAHFDNVAIYDLAE
jgi:hypothetical protein